MENSGRTYKLFSEANEWAGKLGHNYVGLEHYLLAMFDDPVLGPVLTSQGVTPESVRAAIIGMVGHSARIHGAIPPNDAVHAAMSDAEGVAQSMGDEHINPEHVLLAMLKQSEAMVSRILHDLEVTNEELVREVRRLLAEESSTTKEVAERERERLEGMLRIMLADEASALEVKLVVEVVPFEGFGLENLASRLREQGWRVSKVMDGRSRLELT